MIIASKVEGQRMRAHADVDAYIAPEVSLVADAGLSLRLGTQELAILCEGLRVYRPQGNVDPVAIG